MWGCGLNNAAQLGTQTEDQAVCSLVRVGLKELADAVVEQIACSQSQVEGPCLVQQILSCFLKVLAVCADYQVFTWGMPADRPTSMLHEADFPRTPQKMPLSKRVVRLQCGRRHFCICIPACYPLNCTVVGEGAVRCQASSTDARFWLME